MFVSVFSIFTMYLSDQSKPQIEALLTKCTAKYRCMDPEVGTKY